jgi:hypothetical protein
VRKVSQVARQRYCTAAACQRERRRRWQRAKRESDPDYRDNQAQAQRRWRQRHPDYWRDYRRRHPEYDARNRRLQQRRNASRQRGGGAIAKMDASTPPFPVRSGTYRLSPAAPEGIAKMDAWTVEITLLSSAYAAGGEDCKETT